MEMPETRLLPSPGCSTWIRLSASISNVRQQAHFAPSGQRTGLAIILVSELYLPSVQTELPPKPAPVFGLMHWACHYFPSRRYLRPIDAGGIVISIGMESASACIDTV